MTEVPVAPTTDRGVAEAGTRGGGEALRAYRVACALAIALILIVGSAGLRIVPSPWYNDALTFLTLFCVRQHDLPVGLATVAVLVLLALRPKLERPPSAALRPALVIGGLVALVALTWLIRTRVLFDHDFTRDEHMAVFDATIFGSGRLMWPFPAAMRSYYVPLNDLFLLPIGDREAWVSNYLPVNAALRGLLGHVIPLSLVSPLLVGVAGLALWRIARRLWPEDGAAQGVALVCFAGSSQVVLTGTAAFAMTTHLAFNLVWLALFLRGTRAGHAGALATGFLATGIHQPVFHPLFVLPFLDLLRRQKRWRTLAVYACAYLVFGLVWIAWPHLLTSYGVAPPPQGTAEQLSFLARLRAMLAPPNLDALYIMAGNVLRFVTWQHLLLTPLALLGTWRFFREDDLARALALGIVATLLAMTVLMPPQGHGWGYRYLHGLIGNACLLAAFGWRWLRDHGGVPVRAMKVATALSLFVLLPVHTAMVRAFIAPYARAAEAFARLDADYVVVDSDKVEFSTNFVLNRPDLSNRPRLLLGSMLAPWDMAALCPGRTIAFADAPQFADVFRFYLDKPMTAPTPGQVILRRTARAAGCRVITAPVR